MGKLARVSEVKSLILELRGQKEMLDRDLAKLYQVSTKALNQAVKRNREKFPPDFMFRLTKEEKEEVVTFCDHLKELRFSYQLPRAFTRNGANMLATVLKSPVATQRSIQIMRAFSALEEVISLKKEELTESPEVLKKLSIHSKAIMHLFQSDKVKTIKIDKLQEIQHKITDLLQQMILSSLKEK